MTSVATWDDVLEGEELAYVGTEPVQPPRTAPVPAKLDEQVRAALDEMRQTLVEPNPRPDAIAVRRRKAHAEILVPRIAAAENHERRAEIR